MKNAACSLGQGRVVGGGALGNEPAFGNDEAAVEGEEGAISDEKMDEFRDDDDSSSETVVDVENGSKNPGFAFRAT